MKRHALLLAGMLALLAGTVGAQENRDDKVRKDLQDFEAAGDWIYNDLDRGIAKARETDKPLLIVVRCIP